MAPPIQSLWPDPPAPADIRPHEHTVLGVTLRRPGVYRLICTKPGHLKLGMHATIRVKR